MTDRQQTFHWSTCVKSTKEARLYLPEYIADFQFQTL